MTELEYNGSNSVKWSRLMSTFPGDYVYPEDKKELQKIYARLVFLQCLKHEAPETLTFIKDNVLPIYTKLIPVDKFLLSSINNLQEFTWKNLKYTSENCENCFIALIEIINQWSDKFYLADEWIKDMLLLHLPYWTGFPPEKELSWRDKISMILPTEKPDIPFNIPRWNPFLDPWGKYKQRMITFLNTSLDQHKKEMIDVVTKSGAVKNTNRRKLGKHLYWLVEYQIYRKSYGQIYLEDIKRNKQKNEAFNRNKESKVIAAINNTARLMGLSLRKKHSDK